MLVMPLLSLENMSNTTTSANLKSHQSTILSLKTQEPIADTIDQAPSDWESWKCLISSMKLKLQVQQIIMVKQASVGIAHDAIYNHGASQEYTEYHRFGYVFLGNFLIPSGLT